MLRSQNGEQPLDKIDNDISGGAAESHKISPGGTSKGTIDYDS
jgi:hypothetical protein